MTVERANMMGFSFGVLAAGIFNNPFDRINEKDFFDAWDNGYYEGYNN